MSTPRPFWNFFGKLRTRLYLLTILALLPVFALGLYGNLKQRKIERARAEEHIVAVAKLAAAGEKTLFEQSQQLLANWAQFPFIVLQPDRFYSESHCININHLATNHANIGLI